MTDGYHQNKTEEKNDVVPAPAERRNPFRVLWKGILSFFPCREDATGEKIRKVAFLLCLCILLVSSGYLLSNLYVQPEQNEQLQEELENIYRPENSMTVVSTEEEPFPQGMLASFKDLYRRNDEVRGWIRYHATGKEDFLHINYPVMYSGDNDKYLTVDFDEKKNKNGALFFDGSNRVSSRDEENRSLIIYGHNMASGQMFAGLNRLLGNLNNARAASMITLSTLFREDDYLVLAVILTDEAEPNDAFYFNTRRTDFASDEDFLAYVEEMRARSMFDYPVEIHADDQLLVLSTCSNKNSAKVKDGRVVVVARRRRGNEADVDTAKITKNEDVIMPRAWYVNQQLPLHPFYEPDKGTDTTATTTGTTTTTEVESSVADVSYDEFDESDVSNYVEISYVRPDDESGDVSNE